MAENAKNVFVAAPKAGGAIWSASLGTPLPKNAIDPLDPAFNSLGFISEDGIVNAEESDSEDIKAYGGRVVKTVQTSHKETFTFTPIETNKYVLAERYGSDNVTLDERGNIAVAHNAKSKPARCYVIETVLDDGKIARDVIPQVASLPSARRPTRMEQRSQGNSRCHAKKTILAIPHTPTIALPLTSSHPPLVPMRT